MENEEEPITFLKKELITGFFIGILLYIFIFGIRVLKVLIKSNWKFSMIQKGLFKTFNDPLFALSQFLILVLCVAGSVTVYYFYKKGYFWEKKIK